jgi:hypothetical protein
MGVDVKHGEVECVGCRTASKRLLKILDYLEVADSIVIEEFGTSNAGCLSLVLISAAIARLAAEQKLGREEATDLLCENTKDMRGMRIVALSSFVLGLSFALEVGDEIARSYKERQNGRPN